MRRLMSTLCLLAVCLAGAPAAGQEALARRVGRDATGQPLVFSGFTAQDVGALAVAAGVPMGFEPLPQGPRLRMVLTGLTLGTAIDAMLAADPRYEATEEDGVIVFHPVGATTAILDAAAPPVRLDEVTAREALGLVAALLGSDPHTPITATDTKRFALDTPGGTTRSLLNAIVRAHGTLTWLFEPSRDPNPMFPYTLTLMSGSSGWGLGVPCRPPARGLDLNRFRRAPETPASPLDVVVGNGRDGYPLRLSTSGVWAIWSLASAADVPFGVEFDVAQPISPRGQEFIATGRTVRDVLNLLNSVDPRFEWREDDGVVLVRPVARWSDPSDPLLDTVPDVQLYDRPMREIVAAVHAALGTPNTSHTAFPDARPLSVSVWHGTALDLLNALARAHGSLVWTYQPADPDQVRATGLRHQLTLYVAGGTGHGVPVR